MLKSNLSHILSRPGHWRAPIGMLLVKIIYYLTELCMKRDLFFLYLIFLSIYLSVYIFFSFVLRNSCLLMYPLFFSSLPILSLTFILLIHLRVCFVIVFGKKLLQLLSLSALVQIKVIAVVKFSSQELLCSTFPINILDWVEHKGRMSLLLHCSVLFT